MAGKLNLKIYQGATFKHKLTWTDANELPIDLTGSTGRMQVRDKIGGVVLLELSTIDQPVGDPAGNGRMEFLTGGVIMLNISHEDTALITWNAGVYDLEVRSSINEKTRLIEGKVTVSKEVTK